MTWLERWGSSGALNTEVTHPSSPGRQTPKHASSEVPRLSALNELISAHMASRQEAPQLGAEGRPVSASFPESLSSLVSHVEPHALGAKGY